MRTTGAIDCDVHHEIGNEAEVAAYLSEGWREYVNGPGPGHAISLIPGYNYTNPHGFHREDTVPPGGATEGSSLPFMQEQLLDPYGIQHAVLTFGRGLYVAGFRNPYFAAEVARAYNDHMVERWLDEDSRLKGSITLANQVPELAAEEIRRLSGDDRIVQALFATNGVGHPFGHPLFDPIHRAAADGGIPIAIHALGEGAAGAGTSGLAASSGPSLYIEFHSGAVEGMMTHLMSFIFHGVFERYPSLKLVLTEGGASWIPSFLRRLDENFRGLRQEVPWCKRAPSEYFHEHVRVTTQPTHLDASGDPLTDAMEAYGFGDVLMFSSDYPHWDADSVDQTLRRLPSEWRERVLFGNASQVYGLPASVPA